MYEVVGYYTFLTQLGNMGTMVYLTGEMDEYKKNNEKKYDGVACFSEYFRGDLSSKLEVGAEVTIVYAKGFEGKAVAVDILPA